MEKHNKINKYIFVIFIIFINFFMCNTALANDESSIKVELSINSEAAILIEQNSGNVLYEKNSEEKMYPASTTKIMTAILAIENCDLEEKAVVSQNAVDLVPSGYTNAGLVPGEELTIKDLLYALMLSSANEAANVLAEHISGSIDNFAVLMNEKAVELGCENTNFLNANGMHNDNHYTTAKDLAIIANYCFENATFREIIKTYNYTIPATEQHPAADRVLKNTDVLINPESNFCYAYSLGGKTGYTSQAGNCLVCFAKKEDYILTCVLLKANSSAERFSEATSLLNYGYDNFSNQNIISKGEIVDNIEVSNATKETKYINLITNEDIYDYVSNDFSKENLTYEIKLNENISAPVYVGTKVGEITYNLNGKEYKSDLVAESTAYTAHNYGGYVLTAGLILLVISIIIIPKKPKKPRN